MTVANTEGLRAALAAQARIQLAVCERKLMMFAKVSRLPDGGPSKAKATRRNTPGVGEARHSMAVSSSHKTRGRGRSGRRKHEVAPRPNGHRPAGVTPPVIELRELIQVYPGAMSVSTA